MAKKYSQSKSPGKGLAFGLVAAGLTALGYSALFPLYKWPHYLLMAAAALLVGRVVQVMAAGLDTSHQVRGMDELPVTGDEQVDRLVKRGQAIMAEIRQENLLIPDETLSRQIDEMEAVADKIFRTVIEKPGKAPQIRRFMDYYLPTTLKMLKAYRVMDQRGVTGQEAAAVRRKIEDAMAVVLSAFQKQLSTLYQNDILDISTDIDVLETMLKQDSLIGQQFSTPQGSVGAQAQATKEE